MDKLMQGWSKARDNLERNHFYLNTGTQAPSPSNDPPPPPSPPVLSTERHYLKLHAPDWHL